MQERILSLVESLDEARKNVLAQLEDLTGDQRVTSPGSSQWSPIGILEHLIRAERSIFANMPAPDQCIHTPPTLMNRFNRLGIICILKYRVPIPVPAEEMNPQGTTTLDALAEKWGDHMAWLRQFVNGTPPDSINRACFNHPVAGPLTLAQALEMALLHVGYHLPTLKERIKANRQA